MLSKETNELLTQVGPKTPCGELLRRYWHPVAVAAELTEEKLKKKVRIMGEDLVLFRLPPSDAGDKEERYGLLGEHCSHRHASLYYGFIDSDGLRCAYHGWKYDVDGKCLEQPFEKDAEFKKEVCHKAYPVVKLSGLLFTYMGPLEKQPLLPRWDYLAREDWPRKIEVQPVLNCNWLQPMENAVDPSHTRFLHGETFRRKGTRDPSYNLRRVDHFYFEACEWGIRKGRVFDDGEKEPGHFLVFPNMLRHPGSLHYRVPVDDTHTLILRVIRLNPERAERQSSNGLPVDYVVTKMEDGEFHMANFPSQDAMAWETQGPVYDRTSEMLGESDRGITLYRKMLIDQIRLVQQGGEPIALVRDGADNKIIEFVTTEWRGGEE
jgi:5,5'-dehydrodivanillate O-demethylase oxygenase subunit